MSSLILHSHVLTGVETINHLTREVQAKSSWLKVHAERAEIKKSFLDIVFEPGTTEFEQLAQNCFKQNPKRFLTI